MNECLTISNEPFVTNQFVHRRFTAELFPILIAEGKTISVRIIQLNCSQSLDDCAISKVHQKTQEVRILIKTFASYIV